MAYGAYLASDYGKMPDKPQTIDGIKLSTTVEHGDILYNSDGAPSALVLGSFQSGGEEPWTVHGVRMYIAVGLASQRSGGWSTAAYRDAKILGMSGPYLASCATCPDGSGDYVSTQTQEASIDRTVPNDTDSSNDLTSLMGASTLLISAVRAANIEGIPMSIPRPSVAARVAQWGVRIDGMDPTAADNPKRLMATHGFGSSYPQMLCAARYDSTRIFTIREMTMLRTGNVYSSSTSMGLCPVAEIIVP